MSLSSEAKINSIKTLKIHVWHCFTVGLTAKEVLDGVMSALKKTPNGKQQVAELAAVADSTGHPYDEEHGGMA